MSNLCVLIPLDGSKFSEQILPQLQLLFDPATTEVILLRVYTQAVRGLTARPPTIATPDWRLPHYESAQDFTLAKHPIYASQVRDSLRAELESDLLLKLNELRQAGYHLSVEVAFGEPVEEILAVTQARQVDLIAMTTHGRTGLNRLVFNSVAQQVLVKAPVPVLLLHPLPAASVQSHPATQLLAG
jgi:nucleotide-binding universal stress UspA family protein